MKSVIMPVLVSAIGIFCLTEPVRAQKGFSLVDDAAAKKIEVRYDGQLLTAYCYFDSTEKPVLYPIKTVSGVTVTRGYPVAPRPGERTDHPHHLGLWLNYESVNGLDFWNNSDAISAERKPRYGSIRHQEVLAKESKKDKATLKTLSHWVDQSGNVLLKETTDFVFTRTDNDFIIDRISTLEAVTDEVVFKDVKDGMIAIRVARSLEMPSKEGGKYVDAHGEVTSVAPSGADVTGMYVNAGGVKGDSTWGKRSPWCVLNGKTDGETVSIAIVDHPKNVGYPTYWHSRGYGLFAANPLGQNVFSEGKVALNLTLKKGEQTAFRYRIIIHSGGTLTADVLERQAAAFSKLNY
jgi:hypothetical protein